MADCYLRASQEINNGQVVAVVVLCDGYQCG